MSKANIRRGEQDLVGCVNVLESVVKYPNQSFICISFHTI